MRGRVVSTKMNKTVAVLVTRTAKHPLYKKTYVRSKKYLVDDQVGVKEGDIVEIKTMAPISKRKNWQILKVVGRSLKEIVAEELKAEAKEAIEEAVPAGRQVMPEEKSEEPLVVSPQPEEETDAKPKKPRKRKEK